MKRYVGKLQIDGAATMKSRLHARVSSPVATLRITLLALACAAVGGSCIAAVNTPPTAQNLSLVTATSFPTPIVLKGADLDGDPLTFKVVSPPLHGTLQALSATGPNLTYTTFPRFVGTDSFFYVVSDGQATSTVAKVSITVRKYGLSINNISLTEGNSGTKAFTFVVGMTAPDNELDLVSFSFQTTDGTAKAGSDYVATSGTLTFAPDVQGQFIKVLVIGDTQVEFNETFLVQLTSATSNAVILTGTGRGTIVNDDGSRTQTGTAALTPEDSVVAVGEPVNLRLTWTHPVGWRQLDSVDLLILDDQGAILDTRWHEAENSFSILNPAADRFVRTAEAGSPMRFETSAVTLDLQQSSGGGPPGQTATIDFSLSFKPHAAGRTFSVEAFATDDAGNQQGFESVGTITVSPHSHDQQVDRRLGTTN